LMSPRDVSEVRSESLCNEDNFSYGIKTKQGNYFTMFVEDGTLYEEDSGVNVIANRVVRIIASGGLLKFQYDIDGNDNFIDLNAIPWNYQEKVYAGVSIFNNGAVLTQASYYRDPFHEVAMDEEFHHEHLINNHKSFDNLGAVSTKVSLTFANAQAFGFSSTPLEATSSNYEWVGHKPLSLSHIPSNLRIILTNVKLHNYSSKTEKRENILMSLPAVIYDGARILYDRDQPVMMSMLNEFPVSLNHINVRLETFDGNLIRVEPDGVDISLIVS
jgi:hypothetical protein